MRIPLSNMHKFAIHPFSYLSLSLFFSLSIIFSLEIAMRFVQFRQFKSLQSRYIYKTRMFVYIFFFSRISISYIPTRDGDGEREKETGRWKSGMDKSDLIKLQHLYGYHINTKMKFGNETFFVLHFSSARSNLTDIGWWLSP